jgi:hypothetical protein
VNSIWSGNYFGSFEEESLRFFAMDMLNTRALPPFGRAYFSFDLLLTGDWRGDTGYLGPAASDYTTFFQVVVNGQTMLDTTFSTYGFDQGFPGPAGSGNPGGTGAAFDASIFLTVYHFDMTFQFTPFYPDCCTDVGITFSARVGPGYDAPGYTKGSWGIDNFVVSSTPIPEPATGALVGLGLGVLAARRRDPTASL